MADIDCPHCGVPITRAELDAARFDANVAVSGECWEWTAARQRWGYGVFGAGGRNYSAHRWQWERHNGPIPRGLQVMHTCDNPPCVRPDHLRLGSPRDNAQDKMAKGRHRYRAFHGSEHGRARLNEAQVLEMRALRAAGVSGTELARRFGVGRTTAYRILRRDLWAHI